MTNIVIQSYGKHFNAASIELINKLHNFREIKIVQRIAKS